MIFLRTLPKAAQIALGCILVAVLIYALLMVRSCQRAPEIAAQAKVDQGQAGAAINSAVEAMNTVAAQEGNAAQAREIAKVGIDEINRAPAGHSNDAADRAVCSLSAYYHTDKCARLRAAHPAGVQAGGSPR